MNKMFVCMMIVVFGMISAASAGGPDLKPGKWEISMSMEMAGMPFSMPPTKINQCITKRDLEDPKKTVPSADKNDDCVVKDYHIKGNTASWTMVCKDGSTGRGEIIYKGSSYSGNMSIKVKKEKTEVKYKIKGRRIGDC